MIEDCLEPNDVRSSIVPEVIFPKPRQIDAQRRNIFFGPKQVLAIGVQFHEPPAPLRLFDGQLTEVNLMDDLVHGFFTQDPSQ